MSAKKSCTASCIREENHRIHLRLSDFHSYLNAVGAIREAPILPTWHRLFVKREKGCMCDELLVI
jgi:hypothetical protein